MTEKPQFGSVNPKRRGQAPIVIGNKVRRPSGAIKVVPRTRLFQSFSTQQSGLVIVKAAAGFGKTTLLKQLDQELCQPGHNIAWLRIDSSDNEVTRALTYLVAAFAEVDENFRQAMAPITSAIPPHPIEDVVASLIDQISMIGYSITLLIDDYNTITSPATHKAMFYFLCNLPENVRCVVATRSLPPWNLQELKNHQSVTVIEESEIRFTTDETNDYLKLCHNIELQSDSVERFHQQTDGWVTAIKLASISLANKQSPSISERLISGSHAELVGFLAEAVFSDIEEETQDFLLQTSILDRFCPALCDSITGNHNAQSILDQLLRDNLFLEPLDNRGEWFRYHVLFAEFLLDRARKSRTTDLAKLHRKASIWLEVNRQPHAAAEHALAAGDEARRNDLIEDAILEMVRGSQIAQAIGWFESLPSTFSEYKPDVLIPMSWAYAYARRYTNAEELLKRARRALEDFPEKLTDNDKERLDEYLIEVEIGEYDLNRVRNNTPANIKSLREIKDKLRPDWHFLRAYTEVLIAQANIEADSLDAAFAAAADAIIFAQKVPNAFVANLAAELLVRIRYWQGRLDEAWSFCGQSIDQARDEAGDPLPVAGHFNLLAAQIHYERNDLEKSRGFLQEALRLTALNDSPDILSETEILAAQLLTVEQGEAAGAMRLFEFNNDQLSKSAQTSIDRVRSMQAWFLSGCGEYDAAQEVLETLGISIDRSAPPAQLVVTPLTEPTYFAMCRLMVLTGRADNAVNWLRHLLRLAQRSGRIQSCVLVFGLLALAQSARQQHDAALRYVREMLTFASQDKLARTIVDLGPEIINLITDYLRYLEEAPATAERLSAINLIEHLIEVSKGSKAPIQTGAKTPIPRHEPRQDAASYDRLTNRELQILELIARGKTNREVATELLIAESSVRWHVRNLYTKLDVHNRTEASAKGRALRLIT